MESQQALQVKYRICQDENKGNKQPRRRKHLPFTLRGIAGEQQQQRRKGYGQKRRNHKCLPPDSQVREPEIDGNFHKLRGDHASKNHN